MRFLLTTILFLLLLTIPLFGQSQKNILYWWTTSNSRIWKTFGNKEIHNQYKGDIKNGKPHGFGVVRYVNGLIFKGNFKLET